MRTEIKPIPALHGIRVFATAGIFLFHAGFVKQGTFPVTLFFMLSGFIMYYTKRDIITPMTGILKMKQMYPLHLLTFVISIFIWRPWGKYSIDYLAKAGFLQLTLLQSWFPTYTLTFNGLAWYLSITFFLYAISYPLVLLVRNVKKPLCGMILVLAGITAINLYSRIMGEVNLYTNPLYRSLDYLLGMIIAKQYIERDSLPEKQSNKIEIGIVVVFLMQYVTSLWVGETPGYYSVLFTCVLYTFAVGQGCISRVLSHPVFHKLAANSFAFYMIHELALRAFRSVFPEPAVFSMKDYLIRCMLIAVPALIISILFAWCYGQITNRKRM